MIRVVLPAHLRTLAQVDGEVTVRVDHEVTQRTVLDALEATYPVLRGTIRDHVTHKRRSFVRVLRVRAGSVPRPSGHAASRRRRDWTRAFPGRRGDGWRIEATANTVDTEEPGTADQRFAVELN